MATETVADEDYINSDDSIELENTNSGRDSSHNSNGNKNNVNNKNNNTNDNNTNGRLKVRRVPVKGIKQMTAGSKKKRTTATQRDYLISNLNNTKNKQRQTQRTLSSQPSVTKTVKNGIQVCLAYSYTRLLFLFFFSLELMLLYLD